LLVKPGEPQAFATAVERLLNNHDLAHTLGAAGQQHVAAHYSIEIMIERLNDLYRDAAQTPVRI